MINTVTMIGKLKDNPETGTDGTRPIARFTLALVEFYKEREELKKRTFNIPCKAVGRLAEIIGEFLVDGSPLGLTGRLVQEGDKLYVLVTEIELLPRGKED